MNSLRHRFTTLGLGGKSCHHTIFTLCGSSF